MAIMLNLRPKVYENIFFSASQPSDSSTILQPAGIAGSDAGAGPSVDHAPLHDEDSRVRLGGLEAGAEVVIDEDAMMAKRPARERRRLEAEARKFPGCRPVTITRDQIETWEGRLEYWDAETETAWMVREPTGAAHEQPSQRLAGLCQLIAAVRGSPIECFGTMDLLLRNERGERWKIMQADQSVYLHPGRDRLPDPAGMVVGEHDFPDVVVEVDHTTDVRKGKLHLYEAWGFPEVWVEVPDRRSPSRPSGRLPGLAIHLLDGGRYRTGEESRAFPGWAAAEIHTAMNEPELSRETSDVLTRVGRVLGEREGTGPDDMPWLRIQREQGRAQGRAQGRIALLETLMQRIPASQGESGPVPRLDARDLAGITDEEVIDALLQGGNESDFRARLQRLRRPG